jgi:hypothetical protein
LLRYASKDIENTPAVRLLPPRPIRCHPLKKRCRILPAGGLGLPPGYKKSPMIGGYRGLIKTILIISLRFRNKLGMTESIAFLTYFTARMIYCTIIIVMGIKEGISVI